jgi:hypothetical protein
LKPLAGVSGCLLEVDIILESSDGRIFGSHIKNLEKFNEGFPPSEFRDTSMPHLEVILLPEYSCVLSLLLSYMHKDSPRDSSTLPFHALSQLAEAAEKYMVFFCEAGMHDSYEVRLQSYLRVSLHSCRYITGQL